MTGPIKPTFGSNYSMPTFEHFHSFPMVTTGFLRKRTSAQMCSILLRVGAGWTLKKSSCCFTEEIAGACLCLWHRPLCKSDWSWAHCTGQKPKRSYIKFKRDFLKAKMSNMKKSEKIETANKQTVSLFNHRHMANWRKKKKQKTRI